MNILHLLSSSKYSNRYIDSETQIGNWITIVRMQRIKHIARVVKWNKKLTLILTLRHVSHFTLNIYDEFINLCVNILIIF